MISELLRSPLSVFSWKSQAQFLGGRGVSPMVCPPGLAGVNHTGWGGRTELTRFYLYPLPLDTRCRGHLNLAERVFKMVVIEGGALQSCDKRASHTSRRSHQVKSRPAHAQQQRRRRNGHQGSYRSHIRTRTRGHSGTQVLSHSHSFTEDGAHGGPPGTQNQHTVWAQGCNRRVHVHLSVPYRSEAAGWPTVAKRCGGGY